MKEKGTKETSHIKSTEPYATDAYSQRHQTGVSVSTRMAKSMIERRRKQSFAKKIREVGKKSKARQGSQEFTFRFWGR